MQNRDGTPRRADDTDTKMGSARMHLGKRAGFDTLHFLADSAALPWGPRVHAVPPNWGWRHSGGATLGTTHPHPSTKGGCGHRLYATWPAPRDGSYHRKGSRQLSCSPRTPCRNPSLPTGGQRNDEPVHGFFHGGPRASRSGPDPPPIRGLPRSEGEAQARFHLSSGHPWVSREGGRGGFLISRTPLTEPELSLQGRHKATRACARAFGFWAPATGRVLTPAQSEA